MTTKKSIFTTANIITMVRVIGMLAWMVLASLSPTHCLQVSPVMAWVLFGLFVLISGTDKLDGYVARKYNQITDFGKFLDPIADKLVVTISLLYLLVVGLVPLWMPALILAREFLVSGLRMVVSARGVVIAASNLGKWKTATTLVAISVILFGICLGVTDVKFAELTIQAGVWLLGISVVITLWSGIDYFAKAQSALKE